MKCQHSCVFDCICSIGFSLFLVLFCLLMSNWLIFVNFRHRELTDAIAVSVFHALLNSNGICFIPPCKWKNEIVAIKKGCQKQLLLSLSFSMHYTAERDSFQMYFCIAYVYLWDISVFKSLVCTSTFPLGNQMFSPLWPVFVKPRAVPHIWNKQCRF